MAGSTLRMTIRIAWWYRYLYLPGVLTLAWLTRREPDWERLEYWTLRAMSVEVACADT